jgi:oxygen-independent coproporphyrinogen-3 oxidase
VAGIYIHIPFCNQFCTYCNFYSVKGKVLRRNFVAALHREIEDKKVFFHGSGVTPQTVYVGGGTPSLLQASQLGEILSHIKEAFNFIPVEATVEVNPDDITPQYALELFQAGFNRVSMGVQSFHDSHLQWMNRRHTADQAVEAYRILEEAGVDNISIDLIFGLSQMDDALWRETLSKALSISASGRPPKHISAYQLSVEEDSMLEKLIEKGRWSEAGDEVCERQYAVLCETLKAAGYNHYEISNFALPGFEAVHNSAYWDHCAYVGLGPGAHSYLKDAVKCVRQWNESNLAEYLKAAKEDNFAVVQGSEQLDEEQLVMEKVMLGLRTAAGVSEAFLKEVCDNGLIEEALSCGNLVRVMDGSSLVADSRGLDSAGIRIPENRFFVSDNIISTII